MPILSRRRLTGAALALTTLTGLTALTGVAGSPATAAPVAPHVRSAAVGPHDLLRGGDVADDLAARHVSVKKGRGQGAWALSACTGETSFADVAGRDGDLLRGAYAGRLRGSGTRFDLVQHLAEEPSTRRSRDVQHDIAGMLEDCRHEPSSHWHYGRVHRLHRQGGSATWLPVVDGDGTRDGGILVAHVGRRLTTVEVSAPGRGPKTVRALALDTLRRLA